MDCSVSGRHDEWLRLLASAGGLSVFVLGVLAVKSLLQSDTESVAVRGHSSKRPRSFRKYFIAQNRFVTFWVTFLPPVTAFVKQAVPLLFQIFGRYIYYHYGGRSDNAYLYAPASSQTNLVPHQTVGTL